MVKLLSRKLNTCPIGFAIAVDVLPGERLGERHAAGALESASH